MIGLQVHTHTRTHTHTHAHTHTRTHTHTHTRGHPPTRVLMGTQVRDADGRPGSVVDCDSSGECEWPFKLVFGDPADAEEALEEGSNVCHVNMQELRILLENGDAAYDAAYARRETERGEQAQALVGRQVEPPTVVDVDPGAPMVALIRSAVAEQGPLLKPHNQQARHRSQKEFGVQTVLAARKGSGGSSIELAATEVMTRRVIEAINDAAPGAVALDQKKR